MIRSSVLVPFRTFSSGVPTPLIEAKVREAQRKILTPLLFQAGMVQRVPMAALAGLRVVDLTDSTSTVEVPYRFLNKNPYGSTYWAVLGMAAEMTSGLLVTQYTYGQPWSMATLVTQATAQFHKKAHGNTRFTCGAGEVVARMVAEALETGEGREVHCPAVGTNNEGDTVAEFSFTWSVKPRARQ